MSSVLNGPQARAASVVRVEPGISIGGVPLADQLARKVARVVVDSHLHLPDMFEITFMADADTVVSLGRIAVGDPVTVSSAGHVPDRPVATLIAGEVTAIEATFATVARTVVRGYSPDHRMQRRRRTRTFLNGKVSDAARAIAKDYDWQATIEDTTTVHTQLCQLNQTDWDFLSEHARAAGYEFGMAPTGTAAGFYFRKAAGATPPVPLVYMDNLREFAPRLTAGNLAPEAEFRLWDREAVKTQTGVVPVESSSVRLTGTTPASLAASFASVKPAAPAPRAAGAAGAQWGPPPSEKAFVVTDRRPAVGAAAAATEAVRGVAEQLGSTFAEAEGVAIGDPRLRAGVTAEVSGVSAVFSGQWVLTRVRHVFDSRYLCEFEVSGAQERSLLGLVVGTGDTGRQVIGGPVCAIVTDLNDPRGQGRVRVSLPWSSPNYVSDWAPVVQLGAGARSGGMFLPEVNDEVLVCFEHGDPRRPYVLGGLVNSKSTYRPGGPAVKSVDGKTGAVAWRGFVAPSGAMLAFHDEDAPKASEVILGSGDRTMSLVIDQQAGTVTVSAGGVTIQCGRTGTVDIKAGATGTVTIAAGTLNLTGTQGIKIESQGTVEIKGTQVKLN